MFWKAYNLKKKIVLGVAHTDPFFLCKLGPKMVFFRGLTKNFSELPDYN